MYIVVFAHQARATNAKYENKWCFSFLRSLNLKTIKRKNPDQ